MQIAKNLIKKGNKMKSLIDLSTYHFNNNSLTSCKRGLVGNLFSYSLNTLLPIKKKLAFTLAEVLITLGIIGIVAAMTIPTLMSNFAKQKLEEQIKITYSSIQQTMKYMDYEDLGYDVFQDGSDAAIKD